MPGHAAPLLDLNSYDLFLFQFPQTLFEFQDLFIRAPSIHCLTFADRFKCLLQTTLANVQTPVKVHLHRKGHANHLSKGPLIRL